MRSAAVAITVALLTITSRAGADATAGDAQADPPHFGGRFGAIGAYHELYGVPLSGGGLALALGRDQQRLGVLGGLRFIDARTPAGLVVLEIAVDAAAELNLGRGWSVGAGTGWASVTVIRATWDGPLESVGPKVFGRVAYDLGARPNVYVLADVEAQWQASGAMRWWSADSVVWGPTLQAGLRF